MRPHGSKALAVAADLTIHSLEDALTLAGLDIPNAKVGKYDGNPFLAQVYVASQNVSQALMAIERVFVPKNVTLAVNLDLDYGPDEWSVSLTEYSFNDSKVEANTVTVWSPGA